MKWEISRLFHTDHNVILLTSPFHKFQLGGPRIPIYQNFTTFILCHSLRSVSTKNKGRSPPSVRFYITGIIVTRKFSRPFIIRSGYHSCGSIRDPTIELSRHTSSYQALRRSVLRVCKRYPGLTKLKHTMGLRSGLDLRFLPP